MCDAEEAYSETNAAFYDVLVQVEKAEDGSADEVAEKTASTLAAEACGMDAE